MKIAVLVMTVLVMLAMASCTVVRPSDASLLDTTASNARSFNGKVKDRADVPADVKTWINSDAAQWTYFADWANGRPPTTQPTTQP